MFTTDEYLLWIKDVNCIQCLLDKYMSRYSISLSNAKITIQSRLKVKVRI